MDIQVHCENTLNHLQEKFRDLLIRNFDGASYTEPYAIMLSGGSTPLPVYQKFQHHPPGMSEHVHIMLSDERHVPSDDMQNNGSYIRPFAKASGAYPERWLNFPTHLPLEECAAQVDQQIRDWVCKEMHFTDAILGIGPDGHTASLFPDVDITALGSEYAIPVKKKDPPDRISVTPRVLEKFDRIIFLAAGENKQEILQSLLYQPHTIQAGLAVANCKNVELWCDRAAFPA